MKGRNLILMATATLAVGILMIIFRNALASYSVVIGCGILFILAGVANVTVFLGSRDKNGHARIGAVGTAIGWLASAAHRRRAEHSTVLCFLLAGEGEGIGCSSSPPMHMRCSMKCPSHTS